MDRRVEPDDDGIKKCRSRGATLLPSSRYLAVACPPDRPHVQSSHVQPGSHRVTRVPHMRRDGVNVAVSPTQRARVIVVGNEKGGSGKSTTAMHLIASLLRAGGRVGSVDLDARQATLTRYIENRAAFIDRQGIALAMPTHRPVPPSAFDDSDTAPAAAAAPLDAAVAALSRARSDEPTSALHSTMRSSHAVFCLE